MWTCSAKTATTPVSSGSAPTAIPFSPQAVYALGGNTKIWGAVLERMREQEFGPVRYQEAAAPSWGLDYSSFAPWYDRAEALYRVHGRQGVDPTEPSRFAAYTRAPRPLDPLLEELREGIRRQSCHPYDLPLSWSEDPVDPSGDAELFGVTPALAGEATSLRTNARVNRLHVNPSGTEVRGVEAEIDGQNWLFRGDQVVLAAGAVNTAVILLRSVSDRHPAGLANGSGQVGRNLMKPQLTAILQLAARANSGAYPRSLGVNDYYWGDKNVSFPLGHIESGGGVLQDTLFAESPRALAGDPAAAQCGAAAAGGPIGVLVGDECGAARCGQCDQPAARPHPHPLPPQQSRSPRPARVPLDRHPAAHRERPAHPGGASLAGPPPRRSPAGGDGLRLRHLPHGQ